MAMIATARAARACQSCGMPMKRDLQGGGSEVDGTRSLRFCSHCYADGKYTQPELTVEQMQLLVRGRLEEFGVPHLLSGLFTRTIPKLARWRPRERL